jgi:hypothetical protein
LATNISQKNNIIDGSRTPNPNISPQISADNNNNFLPSISNFSTKNEANSGSDDGVKFLEWRQTTNGEQQKTEPNKMAQNK